MSKFLTLFPVPVRCGYSFRCCGHPAAGSAILPAAIFFFSIGVASAVTITTPPVSQQVTTGQPASFAVAATGSGPLTYQWRRNGLNLTGVTGTTYAIAATNRSLADFYDVVVSDSVGSVTSATVRLSVAPSNYPGVVAPDPAWEIRPENSGGTGYLVVALGDGRSYIGGAFTSINGTRRLGIARINADSTVDSTFTPPEFDSVPRSLALQADGKIVIGGDFVRVGGLLVNRLVRLNSDGSVDPTFRPGTGFNDTVLAVAVQADGKILVGGAFSNFAEGVHSYIVRLNADGSIDSNFQNIGTDRNVHALVVQTDGKIVIGGYFSRFAASLGVSTVRMGLARLFPNGTLDLSFTPAVSANSTVGALSLQANGKIVVGGNFNSISGVSTGNIARLNPDGSVDTAFTIGTGAGFDSGVSSIAVQADGRMLVGGGFSNFAGTYVQKLARLNGDGTRDAGFLCAGMAGYVYSVAVQPNGKLLVGGDFNGYYNAAGAYIPRFAFARINSDGTIESGHNFSLTKAGYIVSVLPFPDGKLLITGSFSRLRGASCPYGIARINADGTVDLTFNAGGGVAGTVVYSAMRQPDGKIIMAGDFTFYNGSVANRIARLNADGTIDPSFNTGDGLSAAGYTLTLLPGGKIFVGGEFILAGGVSRSRVAVFNPDGSLYTGFVPGSGANWYVATSALQADGKVIIGGGFSTYRGSPANMVARLNPDGTLDSAFDTTTGASSQVTAVAVQPDGKIVVGGLFGHYSIDSRSGVARLNAADGSLDLGFVPPVIGGKIYSLLVQEDGRILIRGMFRATFGGASSSYLDRLNSDGRRDTSFAAGGFPMSGGISTTLAMRDNGQILTQSSGPAGMSVAIPATAPVVTQDPANRTAPIGGSAMFTVVTAANVLPPRYLWSLNDQPLSNEVYPSLLIPTVQSAHFGSYKVVVSNELGSVTSAVATLSEVAASTTISPTEKTTGAAGETYPITVTSNTNWAPTSNQSWATASPASGSNSGTVNVTVAAHTAVPSRVATITIGGQTHTLTQTGVAPVTTISPLAKTAVAAGETYAITVNSNTNWSAGANQAWVTVLPVSGSGGGTVNVTVAANAATGPRTATITIGGQTHALTQGGTAPFAIISPIMKTAVAAGETYPISVISNTNWSVGSNQTWATVSAASGNNDGTVQVTVAPNPVTASRVATITIGGQTHTLTQDELVVLSAAHAVVGNGYVPGGTVTISNTLSYSGTPAILAWHVLLPTGSGWSYASGGGSEGGMKPAVGTTELLDWSWTTVPPSPVTFTYTLNVPPGTVGAKSIVALMRSRHTGAEVQTVALPDPLVVSQAVWHSGDTNQDWKFNLSELLRVIQLFNTRNGTVRTGCYAVQAGTEDGFAPDPLRLSTAPVTLVRYHNADTIRDGKLSLSELLRVIQLFNHRNGTVRTGEYHLDPLGEDGFAPGP